MNEILDSIDSENKDTETIIELMDKEFSLAIEYIKNKTSDNWNALQEIRAKLISLEENIALTLKN
jgi:hypothetical protein